MRPVGPPDCETETGPLWIRIAWFAGIALATALTTAIIAYGLRALLI
jgi:hypothetical protein